jgi:hypothetical protein
MESAGNTHVSAKRAHVVRGGNDADKLEIAAVILLMASISFSISSSPGTQLLSTVVREEHITKSQDQLPRSSYTLACRAAVSFPREFEINNIDQGRLAPEQTQNSRQAANHGCSRS